MRQLLPFGILLSALGLPGCFAPAIDGTVRMIEFSPDGEIGISDSGIVTKNTIEGLGLGDDERIPGAMVDFQWGGPHISVSTQSGEWRGNGTVEGELSEGGFTIPIGANVDSALDLSIHSAVVTWDLLPGDAELGLGFGVNALDLAGSFQSTSTADRIDFDETIPVPVLAVRANVQVGPVELGGYAAGFQIDYDGDEAQYIDIDIMARLHILGGDNRASGSILAGYRSLSLEVDAEGDAGERIDADLEFAGPFIGAQLSF